MTSMMKSVLTNSELIDELESYSAQIMALAIQIDKLARLKSESRISDTIYAELYEDIAKKVDNAKREKNDLAEAGRARMKEISGEIAELKYRLERLEVRRMLDFITSEKYLAAKEELLKRVGESDEVQLLLGKLVSSTEEACGRIDSCMPEAKQVTVQSAIYNEGDVVPESQEAIVVEPMAVEGPQTRPEHVAKETVAIERTIAPKPVRQEAFKPIDDPKELDIEAMVVQEPLTDELICPRCQTGNPQDGVFCFACGSKLRPNEHAEKKVGPTAPRNEKGEKRDEVPAKREGREELTEVAIQPEVRKKKHGADRYASKDGSNGLAIQKCPKCGMENLSLAAYCYQCNTSLSGRQDGATTKGTWLGRP